MQTQLDSTCQQDGESVAAFAARARLLAAPLYPKRPSQLLAPGVPNPNFPIEQGTYDGYRQGVNIRIQRVFLHGLYPAILQRMPTVNYGSMDDAEQDAILAEEKLAFERQDSAFVAAVSTDPSTAVSVSGALGSGQVDSPCPIESSPSVGDPHAIDCTVIYAYTGVRCTVVCCSHHGAGPRESFEVEPYSKFRLLLDHPCFFVLFNESPIMFYSHCSS